MRPEQRLEVERLFKSAIELADEEREGFLASACGDDETLRRHVTMLVQAHVQERISADLLSRAQPGDFEADRAPSLVGRTIEQYKIISEIGRGGMGVVYRAQDTRLGGYVALKFLTADCTRDEDWLRRFTKEARAARAINHPNILTVHDLRRTDAGHYIVSEFVEGITLREHLKRGRIGIPEVLNIIIQVAAALAAAHVRGIVHRDIKPENVMLREDGYVKVLDFGLVKLLRDVECEPAGPDLSTVTDIHTDSDLAMGTVAYMSPEQLRGQSVDGRTDIWSVGVMLYEMLAGSLPFERTNKSTLIVSILEREAEPLPRDVLEIAPDLQRVVTKELRKDKEDRYENVQSLLDDLRSIRQNINAGGRSQPVSGVSSSPWIDAPVVRTTAHPYDATGALSSGNRRGGLEERTRALGKPGFKLAAAALVVAFLCYWGYRAGGRSHGPSRNREVTTLPIAGSGVIRAVISPDGRSVAMIASDQGQESILVKRIATSVETRIVGPTEAQHRGLSFSPDGEYVYYLEREKEQWPLFRVSVLGGAKQRIVDAIDTPVSFSPDGKQIAFIRKQGKDVTVLVVANSDGTQEHELKTMSGTTRFSLMHDPDNNPAWSPGGSVIACVTLREGEPFPMDVVAVATADGVTQQINARSWYFVGQLSWLSDGTGLLVNASLSASNLQVWRLGYPGGEQVSLMNDHNFWSLSLSREQERLLTTEPHDISSIWIAPGKASKEIREVASSQNKGATGIACTPDDRIVYSSRELGSLDIWRMDMSAGNAERLTFEEGTETEPSVSSDGRTIAFVSDRTGESHIWLMNADGSDQKQLTFGKYEDQPQISQDNLWVVYHSEEALDESIWKVSTAGGTPVRLSGAPARSPVVSPDGKMLACFMRVEQSTDTWKLAVIPFEGGEPLRIFDGAPMLGQPQQIVRWSSDGSALTYIAPSEGTDNIWRQPVAGGRATQLTNFREGHISAFSWSPQGRYLACVHEIPQMDVILIEGFR